jgi:hypothetical protein
MSKQQTAVEWFINELESKGEAWENVSTRRLQINIDVTKYLDLKRQVKEIEEEQIKEAWNKKAILMRPNHYCIDSRDGKDYYNETYGK